MDDEKTTVADLKRMVREFRDRRGWEQFHTPKNLSMAIAVEAAELMEEFLWLDSDEELRLARATRSRTGGHSDLCPQLRQLGRARCDRGGVGQAGQE
jgi:NTP pyrophosphatase (non-canonical NTP hydrolase)